MFGLLFYQEIHAAKFLKVLVWCLVGVAFSARLHVCAQEPTDPSAVSASDVTEVTYDFSTGSVRELLLLGPMDRAQSIDIPPEFLKAPREGMEVQLENGDRYRWQKWQSDEMGLFRLGKFCQEMKASSENAVVYGAVRLRATGNRRRVFLAVDDGSKLWIDGELQVDDPGPGFFTPNENSCSVDFSERDSALALFEFENFGGDFIAQISSGYRLSLNLVSQDGKTPESYSAVSVTAGDLVAEVKADRYGFSSLIVPYQQPIHGVFAGGAEFSIPIDELNSNDVREVTLSVPRVKKLRPYLPPVPMPTGRFTAVTERADGMVLLANSSQKTIFCYNGSRFFRHPDPKLHEFTSGEIYQLLFDEEILWITTEEDGVFRYDGQSLEHWEADQLSEFVEAMTVDSSGRAWVSLSDGSNEKNARLVVLQSKSQPEPVELDWPEGKVMTGLAPLSDGRLAVTGGNQLVIASSGGVDETIEIDETLDQFNAAIAQTQDGSLWLAGRRLLRFCDGEFERRGWNVGEVSGVNMQVVVGADGSVWCLCTKSIYRYSGKDFSSIQSFDLPATSSYSSRIFPSATGSLLVVGESIGLVEIRPNTAQLLNARDGLLSDESNLIAPLDDQVIVSTEGSPPRVIQDGGLVVEEIRPTRPTFLQNQTLVASESNDSVLVFRGLASTQRGVRLGVTSMPYLLHVKDWGTWASDLYQIKGQPWGEPGDMYNAYLFCDTLSDGRILVGTIRGLVELKDGTFVLSDLVPEPLKTYGAFYESAPGDYWVSQDQTAYGVPDSEPGGIIHIKDGRIRKHAVKWHGNTHRITCLTVFQGRILAGTSDGMLELNSESGQFEFVEQKYLEYSQIVGFAGTSDRLWIATANNGVFAMNSSFTLVRLDLDLDQREPHVKTISRAGDGVLWVATSEGVIRKEPSTTPPQLLVEVGLHHDEQVRLSPTSVSCRVGDTARFSLSGRDDQNRLTFQQRFGSGEWKQVAFDSINAEFPWFPLGEESLQIQFRCLDEDFHYSDIHTVQLTAFRPFWERPGLRWFVGFLLCLLAFGIVVLFVLNDRTRARARVAAEQTAHERELLLARVSHDLRNPLSVVAVATDLLKLPNCNQEEVIQFLTASTASMTYLTDQLLTYARSFNERQDLESQEVDALAFLEELEATANLRYADSNVDLQVKVAEGSPAILLVPRLPLAEVLNNLIDNAFRYTDSGTVTVKYAQKDAESAHFQVKDTGSGMSRTTVETLFKPFVRGQNEPSSHKSVGLGMSICQRLVHRLGGSIQVASEEGIGTEVNLFIPVQFADEIDG